MELELVSIDHLCSVIEGLRSRIGAGKFRSYFEPGTGRSINGIAHFQALETYLQVQLEHGMDQDASIFRAALRLHRSMPVAICQSPIFDDTCHVSSLTR